MQHGGCDKGTRLCLGTRELSTNQIKRITSIGRNDTTKSVQDIPRPSKITRATGGHNIVIGRREYHRRTTQLSRVEPEFSLCFSITCPFLCSELYKGKLSRLEFRAKNYIVRC
ncbi:hypothetical protein WN55_10905 [Dufourea novaeangliae]|uniref:Uncharacterized protein n=1 Tax=Dufourea novaeangliae TaxID=178035 RepID=A0A154PBC9_DUFNO|nr:hypothetical protein WN55_10905 [Dufourea novaeangliae]